MLTTTVDFMIMVSEITSVCDADENTILGGLFPIEYSIGYLDEIYRRNEYFIETIMDAQSK